MFYYCDCFYFFFKITESFDIMLFVRLGLSIIKDADGVKGSHSLLWFEMHKSSILKIIYILFVTVGSNASRSQVYIIS